MHLWLYGVLVAVGMCVYRAVNAYRVHKAEILIEKQQGCLPPVRLPGRWPLFGFDNLLQASQAAAESRFMEYLLYNFRRLGHTYQQVLPGSTTIMTIDPANIQAILSATSGAWGIGMRRKITLPLFGDGMFSQDGPEWKHSRDVLRPQLFHRRYDDLEVFRDTVDDLLQQVSEKRGGVVDLEPLFSRMTLDISTRFLFGESVGSLRKPQGAFETALDSALSTIAKQIRFQKLYWLVGGKTFQKSCKVVHGFAEQIIERTLSEAPDISNSSKGAFVRGLAQDFPDYSALRGQVVSTLIAGRDSTACLLSWTLFLLSRNPRVVQKIREEIANLSRDTHELCRSDLLALKYLQNTLKEVLRLYPSTPLISRTATRETTLPTGGGPDHTSPILVRAGTTVLYSAYSLHRRPDLYGMDAELFRPERWEDKAILSDDPTDQMWGYLPFGGGPRVCLGMDFALTEAAYMIVRLLQRFPSIGLPDDETAELAGVEKQTVTIVLRSADGCKVKLG